jgi:superfamily I DNA and RNA helicase
MAKARFGSGDRAFAGACATALSHTAEPRPIYDLILVDEAQDFPPEFLRLCHRFLKDPKRLVYAYDELQTLTSTSVLPPEELFGRSADGKPLVAFDSSESAIPRQDVILEKCYRNSRPVLATAHALGFGIYRDGGLVQMFDQDSLWTDVGYNIEEGELKPGSHVTLARSRETSPKFLEDHSPPDDLIEFITLDDEREQAQWLVEQIIRNIREEELRPEDIVVINPDPLKTQGAVGFARALLFEQGFNSELAGVSTSRDVFSREGSVTFTGIFRAKGNEAGMVYVINAQDCFSGFTKTQTAINRNRLFTAITRSKAWVRVIGIGSNMTRLTEEWKRLRNNDYKLRFTYPTEQEKAQLKLINVDPTPRQAARERRLRKERDNLLRAAQLGDLDVDQLIRDLNAARSKPLK